MAEKEEEYKKLRARNSGKEAAGRREVTSNPKKVKESEAKERDTADHHPGWTKWSE